MKCPRDHTDLVRHTAQGVVIWQCPQCRMLWIPLRSLPGRDAFTFACPGEACACPGCNDDLKTVRCHGHIITICKNCHHAWVEEEVVRDLLKAIKVQSDSSDCSWVLGFFIVDLAELLLEGVLDG